MAGEVRKLNFSDGVTVAEPTDLTAGLVVPEATSAVLGTVKKSKWQTKTLSADISATGAMPDLTFNGLVTNNIYKITAQLLISLTGTSATESVSITCTHGGATMFIARHRNDAQTDNSNQSASNSAIFKASSSTVTFSATVAGTGLIGGDGTMGETFALLEEMQNYADETTDFT